MIDIKYEIDISSQPSNMNIGDFTYKTIRDNIINWNLKPGTMMSEKEISVALNVSRTPVREAFIKMAKEGLVDIMPQRGTIVSRIDLRRVEEERFIRESLEFAVLNVAIEGFPKDACAVLYDNIERQRKSMEDEQQIAFLELDEEFHRAIFTACGKELCWEVVQGVSGHYKRMRVMTLWNKKSLELIIDQHAQLVYAIASGDVKRAQAVLMKHLSKLKGEELEMKKAYPDYFISL